MPKNSSTSSEVTDPYPFKLRCLENTMLYDVLDENGNPTHYTKGQVYGVATKNRQLEILGKVCSWTGNPLAELVENAD